ncbi:LD-carboxypeptidase [Rhodocytophaga aerolata]|uniref:LD-carboxypeptidase n=1 Tax=Rhodocytophaga aerolata TaxID=455078 RepID=A0ABT8RCY0_9BACT|nr:LD-carboxypeptidase [Rhodocytophaga aerolata]MDO1449962.1 LD-carboxypeptidase [Rhodocytophaga aerolata]
MYKSPVFLQKGQTVGLIAPAGKVPVNDIEKAIAVIESWEVKVKKGKYLYEQNFQFAGTDEQRLADFQQMLDDPGIAAILCARGGYGTTRIIDRIDLTKYLHAPKWIAGYSDITALHCHLHARNIQSIHAIMPLTFAKDDTAESVESLRKVLFGESIVYESASHEFNRPGKATGPIVGGNLALLASICGTASDIDTAGKILFIEDISEYFYNIDRMMIQLKRTGKLDKLSGLIIGHFTDSKDNETPFGKNAYEIVLDAVKEYSYPLCFGFPIGHEPRNFAIPCGRVAVLEVNQNRPSMLCFDEGAKRI